MSFFTVVVLAAVLADCCRARIRDFFHGNGPRGRAS